MSRHRFDKLSRRQFVTASAATALKPPQARPAEPVKIDGFPVELAQGMMAGEVTGSSVILQTRLTSTSRQIDPRWLRVPGYEGVARFEIATSPEMRSARLTEWTKSAPEWDYVVKTAVRGLQSGTRYYYRVIYGPTSDHIRRSEIGTFRTHPPADDAGEVKLAIITCMNYSFFHYSGGGRFPPYSGPDKALGYPGLAVIRRLKPDYLVATGDNVYYDHPGVRGRAETQQQMRMKFQEQFSQPRMVELLREIGSYWMKDDHDYRFNDADPINPVLIHAKSSDRSYPKTNLYPHYSGSGFMPDHETGIRIFREQMPTVDLEDPNAVTYRTYRINKLLQIWMVEGRDYRSPNDMPDGPEKSIWGKTQKEWLKRTVLESEAAFKILITPTPMVGPDSAGKRDNHTDFGGFRHEGEEFFRWLVDNGLLQKNFYIVNGDRHWQYHAIHPLGIEEFSVGTMHKENAVMGAKPGQKNSTDPEGKIKQPYHSKEPLGGFLLLTVNAETGAQRARANFQFYRETGDLLHETSKSAQIS